MTFLILQCYDLLPYEASCRGGVPRLSTQTFALLQNFLSTEFLGRRLAAKLTDGQKDLVEIAKKLEENPRQKAI